MKQTKFKWKYLLYGLIALLLIGSTVVALLMPFFQPKLETVSNSQSSSQTVLEKEAEEREAIVKKVTGVYDWLKTLKGIDTEQTLSIDGQVYSKTTQTEWYEDGNLKKYKFLTTGQGGQVESLSDLVKTFVNFENTGFVTNESGGITPVVVHYAKALIESKEDAKLGEQLGQVTLEKTVVAPDYIRPWVLSYGNLPFAVSTEWQPKEMTVKAFLDEQGGLKQLSLSYEVLDKLGTSHQVESVVSLVSLETKEEFTLPNVGDGVDEPKESLTKDDLTTTNNLVSSFVEVSRVTKSDEIVNERADYFHLYQGKVDKTLSLNQSSGVALETPLRTQLLEQFIQDFDNYVGQNQEGLVVYRKTFDNKEDLMSAYGLTEDQLKELVPEDESKQNLWGVDVMVHRTNGLVRGFNFWNVAEGEEGIKRLFSVQFLDVNSLNPNILK